MQRKPKPCLYPENLLLKTGLLLNRATVTYALMARHLHLCPSPLCFESIAAAAAQVIWLLIPPAPAPAASPASASPSSSAQSPQGVGGSAAPGGTYPAATACSEQPPTAQQQQQHDGVWRGTAALGDMQGGALSVQVQLLSGGYNRCSTAGTIFTQEDASLVAAVSRAQV